MFHQGTIPSLLNHIFLCCQLNGNYKTSHRDPPPPQTPLSLSAHTQPSHPSLLFRIRPLSNPNTFRRLSGATMKHHIRTAVCSILARMTKHRQFGSMPDGPAIAAHLLRHALAIGLFVLGADISEAYSLLHLHRPLLTPHTQHRFQPRLLPLLPRKYHVHP